MSKNQRKWQALRDWAAAAKDARNVSDAAREVNEELQRADKVRDFDLSDAKEP